MPELPEVEAVRRLIERALLGETIDEVEVAEDNLVVQGCTPGELRGAILGQKLTEVGRKGKTWWLGFANGAYFGGHLGMSGWVRELGQGGPRLVSHGRAPLDDADGRPRFLKLGLKGGNGRQVVLTDGRRLARLWPSSGPAVDPKITRLGPDSWLSPPSSDALARVFGRKKAPVKAALLDQALFAGVGNWVADEVLYHARLAPARLCSSLDRTELGSLLSALKLVLDLAVEVEADAEKYPADWLFTHRWGGRHGSQELGGHAIVREQIAGRTTAWLPSLQK